MKYFILLTTTLLWGMACSSTVPSITASPTKESKKAPSQQASSVQLEKDVGKHLGNLAKTIVDITDSHGGNRFHKCTLPPTVCPNRYVTFWYYSSKNPDKVVRIDPKDRNTFKDLPKDDEYYLVIHGYAKSKDDIPNPQIRKAFFKDKKNRSIISVDYAPLAKPRCYVEAVSNVPLIANCTAEMLDELMLESVFRAANMHVIGFGLGAQVAGSIAKYMKHRNLYRITGLDPASPLFDGHINKILKKGSANYVDILHTNGNVLGMANATGDADFYFNGGSSQKGCENSDPRKSAICSHERSVLYFAEAIVRRNAFFGVPCGSYEDFKSGKCKVNMDELVRFSPMRTDATGKFYLDTNSKPPFGRGGLLW